jgi:hypothetical protein
MNESILRRDEYIKRLMAAGQSAEAAHEAWTMVANSLTMHETGIDRVAMEVAEVKVAVLAQDKRIGEAEKNITGLRTDVTALQKENESIWWWMKAGSVPVLAYTATTAFDIFTNIANPKPVPVQVMNPNDNNNR